MTVIYPPEPIVAEAACHFLSIDEHDDERKLDQFVDQLDKFSTLCLNGLVSAGEIGEFLGRFCISFCYDRAIVKRKQISEMSERSTDPIDSTLLFSTPLTLQEFLDQLLPASELQCLALSQKLLQAEVCFTNWAHLDQLEPDEPQFNSYLKECFNVRTAVIMPQDHVGADLLIPMRFRSTGENMPHTYSYILVQIKNRRKVQSAHRLSFAGECLKPSFVLGPSNSRADYLSIYFETNRFEDDVEAGCVTGIEEFRGKFPCHALLLGFSSCPALNEFPKILDSLHMHHHYHVQHANIYDRPFHTLNTMAPQIFRFAYHDCNCKRGCQNNTCGCKRRGLKCNSKCHKDADNVKECQNM